MYSVVMLQNNSIHELLYNPLLSHHDQFRPACHCMLDMLGVCVREVTGVKVGLYSILSLNFGISLLLKYTILKAAHTHA